MVVTANQVYLQPLTTSSVAGGDQLQLGVVYFSISVALLNWLKFTPQTVVVNYHLGAETMVDFSVIAKIFFPATSCYFALSGR